MNRELKWKLENSVTDIMSAEAYAAVAVLNTEVAQKAIMSLIKKEAYKILCKTEVCPNGFTSDSFLKFTDFQIGLYGRWYSVGLVRGTRTPDPLVFTDPVIRVAIA